jgi:hypothetical protein
MTSRGALEQFGKVFDPAQDAVNLGLRNREPSRYLCQLQTVSMGCGTGTQLIDPVQLAVGKNPCQLVVDSEHFVSPNQTYEMYKGTLLAAASRQKECRPFIVTAAAPCFQAGTVARRAEQQHDGCWVARPL